jgi:hypothetical protein
LPAAERYDDFEVVFVHRCIWQIPAHYYTGYFLLQSRYRLSL